MSINDRANNMVRRLDWIDIGLIKWSVLFFTLFLAKIWEPILSLSWQTYLVLFLVVVIRPAYKAYFVKSAGAQK